MVRQYIARNKNSCSANQFFHLDSSRSCTKIIFLILVLNLIIRDQYCKNLNSAKMHVFLGVANIVSIMRLK